MIDAAIFAGRVLLGPAGQSLSQAGVLVRRGLITHCGSWDEISAHAGPSTPRFAFPNSTLLPGLINSHVHLAFDTSDDPVGAYQQANNEELIEGIATRAAQTLRAGITTVRDLGGPVEVFTVRDRIADGHLLGPRIVASGPPLTVPHGHCWFFGAEVELDTDAEDTLRAMVQCTAEAGADLIKVMASGGHLTPGGAAMYESQFTTEHLKIIVSEKGKQGCG